MTLKQKTPLKRTSPMRASSIMKKPKPPKGARKRKCKVCRSEFEPRNMMHVACGADCAEIHGVTVAAKQRAKKERQERAQDKAKREGMKTYPQLIKDVQRVFNQAVRLRDQIAKFPCISSGRPLDWSGNMTDCGHFRSTGSAPHLRFNFDNAHAQTKQENRFLSGNAVDYRIGLIARIGLERVEALEADNIPRKWSRDELQAMKEDFQRLVREYKKEQS